ncbi:MAG: hypothetical protein IPL78_25695 [Chloroflexi bacterium]|nr:hypothetical protein [Chloroflexota bacterium]
MRWYDKPFFRRFSPQQIGLFLLLGYAILPLWFPLAPYHHVFPQYDIRRFTPSLGGGLLYGLWLVLMSGACWLVYRRVQMMAQPPRLRWFAAASGLFCLLLVWVYPINATDVYRYFIRGRVTSLYQANPFVTTPAAFPDDPYFILAGEWADYTSPYGPVWEGVAGLVTWLFPDHLLAGLVTFKVIGAAAFLGSGLLLWGLLVDWPPGARLGRTLLWLWNPALLLIFVADGHNDGLMLFWLLLGVWLWRRGRVHLAWLVLPLAPLTKLIGLLALPFIFLGMWRTVTPGPMSRLSAERVKLFLVALFASVGLFFLAFLPFGSPFALLYRLVQESRGGAGFSPLTLVYFLGEFLGVDVTVAQLADMGSWLFVLLAGVLLWWTWRGRDSFRSVTDIFAGYVVQALSFRLWYAAWLFPWTLVDPTERRLRVGFLFLLTTQLSVLIYGHLNASVLGNMALAHLIGIPFTFILPLLLAGYGSPHTPHLETPQTEK